MCKIGTLSLGHQGGFRKERSNFDQNLTMRKHFKTCWEQNVDEHHAFVDFQAPYGSVWRKEIWSEMKMGFPKKLVKLWRIVNN